MRTPDIHGTPSATDLILDSAKDRLYLDGVEPRPFRFNRQVAQVFDDMISRSVPLYLEVTRATVDWAERFYQAGTEIYDIGCSTGTAIEAMARRFSVKQRAARFVGIDNSSAMLEKAETKLRPWLAEHEIVLKQSDAQKLQVRGASFVVVNYTLQFLPVEDRLPFLTEIHRGLVSGGMLFLSEKISAEDPRMADMLITQYHEFKQTQGGYSRTEIERKREALDRVLVPLPFQELTTLFTAAGFRLHQPIYQWNNFTTIAALKD